MKGKKKRVGFSQGQGDSEELAEGLAAVVEETVVGTAEVVTKKGTWRLVQSRLCRG